jgi:hypothetical protein
MKKNKSSHAILNNTKTKLITTSSHLNINSSTLTNNYINNIKSNSKSTHLNNNKSIKKSLSTT